MFFRPQKGGTNHEKRAHLGSPFVEFGPKIVKGPIPIQKVDPKGALSEFWRGAQRVRASELASHPVCMSPGESPCLTVDLKTKTHKHVNANAIRWLRWTHV